MSLVHTAHGLNGMPDGPTEARTAVGLLLDETGALTDEAVRLDILMVISELVSNAEQHTAGIRAFDVAVDDDTLDVHVRYQPCADSDFHMTRQAGWGWTIVTSIAASVTVTHPAASGKRVRLLLQLH